MSVTVDTHLSNFARGLVQDRERTLADFLAPIVPVPTAAGDFTKFNEQQNFLAYDASRARGQNPRQIHWKGAKGTYSTEEYGLGTTIDPGERRKAGPGAPVLLEESKTKLLIDNTLTAHENSVMTVVKAGVSSTAKSWSNDANDPIKDIRADAVTIYKNTGRYPNAIAVAYEAWNHISGNAKVRGLMPGSDNATVTAQILVAMLQIPGLTAENVRIGSFPIDSAKMGGTSSKAEALGSELWLFHRSSSPGLDDPSFAKTFEAPDSSLTQIHRWLEGHIEHFDTLWAVDPQVVAAASAKRYAVS